MLYISKRIQRWRKERQLVRETEACEAEKRTNGEERDNHQAQALLLTLRGLQRTMDPLIAAQVYNNRFCPLISRLPEELLLCIFDFLCDDVVALKCLRIVSRIFLRLFNRQLVVWIKSRSIKGESFHRHDVPMLEFRRLLQRDGRCDNCRRWNDVCGDQLFDDCKFQQRFRRSPKGSFDFLYSTPYCYACHTRHDVCQFPSPSQQSLRHQPERRCLGQQGSVQLCEHIQITWARIKAHIDNWRQQQQQRGGGDWQACLNSFNIECHEASHDKRCTASEAPTWPRARLGTSPFVSDTVVLNLEWTPHSRIDTLTLTGDGRIPSPELRALFQKLRSLGPADTLCPASHPDALPEMMLFGPSTRIGHFVYYKTGEDDKIGPLPAAFPPLPSESSLVWRHRYGSGRNGKKLSIRPHYPVDAVDTVISSQCLAISYEKDIMICRTAAMTDFTIRIIPTDDWLHAMDTQTYPHPQASHIRPKCTDVACVNYYRRRKDYYFCPTWHRSDLVNVNPL